MTCALKFSIFIVSKIRPRTPRSVGQHPLHQSSLSSGVWKSSPFLPGRPPARRRRPTPNLWDRLTETAASLRSPQLSLPPFPGLVRAGAATAIGGQVKIKVSQSKSSHSHTRCSVPRWAVFAHPHPVAERKMKIIDSRDVIKSRG